MRITNGVCRYTAAYTPPGDLPVGGSDPYWSSVVLLLKGGTRALEPRVVAPQAVFRLGSPPVTTPKAIPGLARIRDVFHGGNGRVTGTVKVKGSPDYPVQRRARLIRERDGVAIRETWSDPVTGVYTFDGVDRAEKYTVLAYDHTLNFRATVADNLTPEVMP